MRTIRRVGHRGAGAYEPQNTVRSFERAIAMGVDMVETDLRRSRDGALVLAHDAVLTADGQRLVIANNDLAALRSLDLGHGERILTLEMAFEVVRNPRGLAPPEGPPPPTEQVVGLMIDLKEEGLESELVAAIHASGLLHEQIIVPGGSRRSREILRGLDPQLPLSLSLDAEWDDRITPEFVAQIDTVAVTWQHPLISPERVALLHERDLFVYAWTVDDLVTMQRVIDAGVDGVITNRPDLFARL
jgi:glycerophosphoryl diester phosphodiesterase